MHRIKLDCFMPRLGDTVPTFVWKDDDGGYISLSDALYSHLQEAKSSAEEEQALLIAIARAGQFFGRWSLDMHDIYETVH